MRNFSEKSYVNVSTDYSITIYSYTILSTNIDIVKLFCVLHNKLALLTGDVLSREKEIVTKEFLERFYLTMYI